MNRDINYLIGKLELIHDDVRELQLHVDQLRQEAAGRKAVNKFILSALAIVGAALGWLVTTVLSLTKGGTL